MSAIRFGVDIGGTGVKGAPVDIERGELVGDRFRLDTPAPSTPEKVAAEVAAVVRHFEWDGPAGITFPGVVMHDVVLTAANVDQSWAGCDAGALFRDILGQPMLEHRQLAAGVPANQFQQIGRHFLESGHGPRFER